MAVYSLGRRRVIALLVLSSILLMTLDLRGNAAIERVRSAVAVLLSPFDTAARTVSRPIVNAWHGVTDYARLQQENERLQEQIDRQHGAEIEAEASILEYQQLLQLYSLTSVSSYPTVLGEVQGESPSNFSYTVEINKGSADGVQPGMPVVNQAGLVGRIRSVSTNSSIVLLITDPEFSVGVKILTAVSPSDPIGTLPPLGEEGIGFDESTSTSSTSTTTSTTTTTTTTTTLPPEPTTTLPSLDPPGVATTEPATDESVPAGGTTTSSSSTTTSTTLPEVVRETGMLSGQGRDEPLIVRFVDASSASGPLRVGSKVRTAGGKTSNAPANIPVGTVSRVSTQSGTSALVVEIEPGADLSKLNYLAVILYDSDATVG